MMDATRISIYKAPRRIYYLIFKTQKNEKNYKS
jgi:hypothetical protein